MNISVYKAGCLVFILLFALNSIGQTITTVAGNGDRGHQGDNIPATLSELWHPGRIAVDDSGNLYIIDYGNDNIRKVAVNGMISIISGDRHEEGSPSIRDINPCDRPDGIPATTSMVWKPQGIAVDHRGAIYFTENCGSIRRIDTNGTIKTVAYTLKQLPGGIAIDKDNNIYYADTHSHTVQKIATDGTEAIIAGCGLKGYKGDGAAATDAWLDNPTGIAVDDSGNIYFSDNGNECVRKINKQGIITTIAGSGEEGYSGDNGFATKATLHDPMGIACDHYGNLYIADAKNDAIRRVDANGIITTFAGNGKRLYHGDDGFKSAYDYSQSQGNAGDGGPASAAQLYWPMDVAVDNTGNVYIADDQHHTVRKVTGVPHTLINKPAEETADFQVAANEEQTSLFVTADTSKYNWLTIADVADKIFINQTINDTHTTIDVSGLLPGRYYLNLSKGAFEKRAVFNKQ